jgi:hypothetical protein
MPRISLPQAIGYESFLALTYLCLSSVCVIAFVIKLVRCELAD